MTTEPVSYEGIRVPPRIWIDEAALEWSYARSGGPGGQNVNKVNSKAVMRWLPIAGPGLPADVLSRFRNRFASRLTNDGELVLASDEHRDQRQNQEACRYKLAEMLRAVAIAPKIRRPTAPSAGSQRRRLADKKRNQQVKQDRQRPSYDRD